MSTYLRAEFHIYVFIVYSCNVCVYNRGYYRCSSSKGCSARKQVERSRTDPNLLVITYTSEHNHPWPTQRNALAGSTRSQPSKNNTNMTKNNNVTAITTSPKEEHKDQYTINNVDNNNNNNNNGSSSTTSASVKEEIDPDMEKQLDSMDDSAFSNTTTTTANHLHHDVHGFGYRPAMAVGSNHDQDFFADLGEIEADPLNLLFSSQGFPNSSAAEDRDHDHQHKGMMMMNNKGFDPFNNLFDWSGGDGNNKQRD